MVEPKDIKAVATPQDVARKLLGSPAKERRNELWYKSPFRQEKDASFEVTDRGFHDFGTNEHYDIFGFVQRLRECSFKDSVETLANMYGIQSRTYESKKLAEWCKSKREQELEHQHEVEWFYLRVWDEVDAASRENQECLELFKGDLENDSYKICLDEQVLIMGMQEHLAQYCDTFEDKEELYQKGMKGELPRWLQMRIRKYTSSLTKSGLKISQRLKF